MNLSQRQINLGLFCFLTVAAVLGAGLLIAMNGYPSSIAVSAAAAIVFSVLGYLYWRGWEPARYVAVIVVTFLTAFGLQEPGVSQTEDATIFIPAVLALALTGPAWVAGCALATLTILIARAGGQGVYTDRVFVLIYATLIGMMVLSRLGTDTARRLAAANARAAAARAEAEQQAHALAERNDELARLVEEIRRQSAEQARLLEENQQQREALRELSVPVLPVARGTLVMPLIGALDSARLLEVRERALDAIQRTQARRLVLDVTGVPLVDTQVAKGLLAAVQAARLLGADVALVGIRPEVAQSIVGLGLDLSGIRTASDLATALGDRTRSPNH